MAPTPHDDTAPATGGAATAYDVLVLGAGSGGYACALRAAQLGQRVALVERDKVGGTCLHVGCIPTKAMLHAAEVADSVRTAGDVGVTATVQGVDAAGVRAYADRVVSRLHQGLQGLVSSRGIDVLTGEGRLTGPREVTVDGTAYTADHVVLATGSAPRTLPGVTVDDTRVITSAQALRLEQVPGSVVVLGGGVVGCEFASAWASFGSEVTVVETLDRLLPTEDADSSRALQRTFRKRGITTRTSTRVATVTATDDGVRVDTEDGTPVTADLVLVAVGRGPVTEGLGLAEQGVTLDAAGFVVTDPLGRTSLDGVYAVGDLVPGLQLAHRGFAHGVAVAEEIAGLAPQPVSDTVVPRVTYSRPEVAAVGLTEAEARATHGDDAVATVTYDLAGNGRSQIRQTGGHVKVVRRVDGPVVGVHLVGDGVSELVGEAQLICGWEAHPEDVVGHLHAHPTQNEALGEAHLALAGKALHAHT